MTTTTQIKKKVAPKKSARKPVAQKQSPDMVYAEGEQCFWAGDGHILSSLYDLEHALACMDRETYGHHVTRDKNDFAAWVEFVLLDPSCAEGLRNAKSQKTALSCVGKRLGRAT